MLQLARKKGEAIIINDSIHIRVIEVKGKVVKLGFDFPDGVQVFRQELYERIQKENKAAQESAVVLDEILEKQSETGPKS